MILKSCSIRDALLNEMFSTVLSVTQIQMGDSEWANVCDVRKCVPARDA